MSNIFNPIIIKKVVGGEEPTSTDGGTLFSGATIPLTYKDNTHTYENNYTYKSSSHDITITGLEGRATILNNGTKEVEVQFDVTSATTSLQDFTITLVDGEETLTYNGMHAHYGETVTSDSLVLAYTHIPRTGVGTVGTEYVFIEDNTLPYFANQTTLWNGVYSYQILNGLFGNYSGTSIGNDFLRQCHAFNQPITIPEGVTTIGNLFLYQCSAFNQTITIPSDVTTIGGNFLRECHAFNQPITIPSGVTSIGTNFLHLCHAFNQPITIPSGVTSIGNLFLYQCHAFNQPITIPSDVTTIGTSFLRECSAFNQPITIPEGVTTIGTGFLQQCSAFNQPITIPEGVTTIGTSFLQQCSAFNQPITIPSTVTTIGTNFLHLCYAFNQPITIPSDVTSIGTNFLQQCYSLSTITWNSEIFPTDNFSLSQNIDSKTSENGEGIKVYGTQRAGLLTALPDRTTSPFRKLIDGGAD